MLFNSGEFLIFFPIVVLAYYLLPGKLKNSWLLIASYYFYMSWNAEYALLLLLSTLVTYAGALLLEWIRQKYDDPGHAGHLSKAVLAAVLTANLAILFYFKYFNFALDIAENTAHLFGIELNIQPYDILLPVGISFYIFQALGYLIDVYRGDVRAERNLLKYALFVSFFPQLVAGPIERSKNLLGQLDTPKKFDIPGVRDGLLIMLWGYFLKLVIADRCALLVDTVYDAYEEYRGFQLVLANVMFAIQIYCDFMGYSTIAKGAAKVLGIRLMDNFEQPYFAESVREFWRRWHISLSTWFRDYVYIPLGGSRCSRLKKYRNVFVTFAVSGLWHGASMNFVLWGIIHGLYQIAEDLLSPVREKLYTRFKVDDTSFSWRFFRILKTFVLVDIAWIFFRARSLHSALYILRASFDLSNIGMVLNDGIYELGLNTRNMNLLVIALAALVTAGCMRKRGVDVRKWLSGQNLAFRYMIYWGAVIMIILSLDLSGMEFIYFQF